VRRGSIALLLLLVVPPTVTGLDLSFRAEAGFFNQAYQDRQYLTSTMVSFGVPYTALGAEARHRDAEGNVLVLGLAQTSIASGSTFNWDRWESQPLTLLNLASLSVGKDFGWWELDAGVAGLVQLKDFPATAYTTPTGDPQSGRRGGLDWNRRESFTLITGLLRLFPETDPHLTLRVARGPLSLTENLFHVQGVWPLGTSRLDAELGFSSPMGLWFSGDGVLRSNERLTLGWAWGGTGARLGLRLGFLLRTIMAGSGEVDLLHRLSVGLDWSLGSP